mmetsp:Transcript_57934/g.163582  ORF Transcript_57934/g.163582 Transcript_57934/m.163582 type:complete len:199 (+) Transcript_57934:80-676(+)
MADEDGGDFYGGRLTCPACGGQAFTPENDEEAPEGDADAKEDAIHASESNAMCLACGQILERESFPWIKMYNNYCAAIVEEAQAAKKLNKLKVRIAAKADGEDEGDESSKSVLSIVTNDMKVKAGELVVVAGVGAIVPAGKGEDGEVVKKATVGGLPSEGMLCDSPMLGWVGGAKGVAVRLSADKFTVGDRPPARRPR